MPRTEAPLVAVICENDRALADVLVRTLRDLYGVRVAATVTSGAAVVDAVAAVKPDIVVVDVALAGRHGVRIAALLRDRAPECAVVVAAPHEFAELRFDAVAHGATTLVDTSDLRPLQCAVERLVHLHDGCESCAARAREG